MTGMWHRATDYHRPSTYEARDNVLIALRRLMTELHDEFADIEPGNVDGASLIAADGAELVRIAQFMESLEP